MVRPQESFPAVINCFIDETAKKSFGEGLVEEVLTTSSKVSVTQCRSRQRPSWKGYRGSMIDIVHTNVKITGSSGAFLG